MKDGKKVMAPSHTHTHIFNGVLSRLPYLTHRIATLLSSIRMLGATFRHVFNTIAV